MGYVETLRFDTDLGVGIDTLVQRDRLTARRDKEIHDLRQRCLAELQVDEPAGERDRRRVRRESG